ncbi:acyltransferase [Thalassospira sp. MA62]|nr:acyltransferase [Thalassospira sp. MA62]
MIDIVQILRGTAVLLVVLFHLDVALFRFGYIGVDIFFAISGYLMPIIIHKYSAWDFVKARTVRLYPAIVAAVLVVLIAGLAIQTPGEISDISTSAIFSLLNLSNIYFYYNTGYFDLSALHQPLLHTWSLGAEYICYLILAVIIAAQRELLKPIALAIAIVCGAYTLALAIFGHMSYLNPVPRAYIFFVSAYVSCWNPTISSRLSTALAVSLNVTFRDRAQTFYIKKPLVIFALTVVSLTTFFATTINRHIWPSLPTLLIPAVVLPLILLLKDKRLNDPISKLFRKIGDWSYSIYIWHWPIIILEMTYLRNTTINEVELYLLLALSMVAGVISYKFIERNRLFIKLTPFAVALIGFILVTDGASFRVPTELEQYASVENMTNFENFDKRFKIDNLNIYKSTGTDQTLAPTLIVGDSHGQHIMPIYRAGFAGDIYRIDIGPHALVKQYWSTIRNTLKKVKAKRLVFAFRWGSKSQAATGNFIDKLNQSSFPDDYETTILHDIPSFDGDPVACLLGEKTMLLFKTCGFDIMTGIPLSQITNNNDDKWQILADSARSEINMIDTHKALCNDEKCITTIKGTFIMRDYNHLNERMPETVNEALYKMFFGTREEDSEKPSPEALSHTIFTRIDYPPLRDDA